MYRPGSSLQIARNAIDLNSGDPSPLRGVPCRVLRTYGAKTEAGTDALVELLAPLEELVERHRAGGWPTATREAVADLYASAARPGVVCVEVDLGAQVEPA